MKYQKIKKYRYKLAVLHRVKTSILNAEFKHKLFELDAYGNLSIHTGYMWNGVNFPAINTKNTINAGCVHDALYQAIRLGLLPLKYKKQADLVYYNLLLLADMWVFRAKYHWQAVDSLGAFSCIPGEIEIPDVLTV